MPYEKALAKAMRYCSFQERCPLDLKNRFVAWNVEKTAVDKILAALVEADFLNERRYVAAFISGKFTIKKWGKNKIRRGLIEKGIYNEAQFEEIFKEEIEAVEYYEKMVGLIEKKNETMEEKDTKKRKVKIYRFMLGKGYESELIAKALSGKNVG